MSGPVDEGNAAVAHRRGDCARLVAELGVERAGEGENGHREICEARCEPSLGTRARQAQRRGEPVAVAAPRRGVGIAHGGEEWLGEPFGEEGVGTDLLDATGEELVGLASLGPCRGILDAARRAQQDQASNPSRVGESQVQGHASAERVSAEVNRFLTEGVRNEVGSLGQGGAHLVGVAVARQVERPDLPRTCQNGSVLVGRGSGLGEAVEPREGCARALARDGEE